MGLPGIDVVGPLPPAVQIETVFAGGVVATSARAPEVQALLRFMAHGDGTAALKQAHGMAPA
jgi:molybdate transport system substrate-binding protein